MFIADNRPTVNNFIFVSRFFNTYIMFRSHLLILDLQAASWEHFSIGNCDAVLLGK